jgi:hypothetical protein
MGLVLFGSTVKIGLAHELLESNSDFVTAVVSVVVSVLLFFCSSEQALQAITHKAKNVRMRIFFISIKKLHKLSLCSF